MSKHHYHFHGLRERTSAGLDPTDFVDADLFSCATRDTVSTGASDGQVDVELVERDASC